MNKLIAMKSFWNYDLSSFTCDQYLDVFVLNCRWAKCPAAAKAGYEKKAAALKVKQQAEMAKYKAAKAKAAGPKRALSAFFIFAADERPKVVSANPSASIGEIGKELGAR